jgi:general secretion pathway protein K
VKTNLRPSEGGIAILIVMVAIFVLTVLVGAFAYSMKLETKLAMNANQETSNFWETSGISGVEAARWYLAMISRAPNHNKTQKWAGGPGDEFETNGVLATVSLSPFQIDDVIFPFSITIKDMDSLANINTANRELLEQGLMLAQADAGEIPSTASAILDWIDRDDVHNMNGAESDHYQGLNPPYYAKNAAMDDISELQLVRGITGEIYEGRAAGSDSFARPTSRNPFERPLAGVDIPGMKELFTTVSSGKININTASREVLQLLPGINDIDADCIIDQRSIHPFRNVGELVNCIGGRVPMVQPFCSVQSRVFEVEVTVEGSSRSFFAILSVVPTGVKVLAFKELK